MTRETLLSGFLHSSLPEGSSENKELALSLMHKSDSKCVHKQICPQENLFLRNFWQKIDTSQDGNCTTGNGYNASRKYWKLSKIKYTWRTD